MLSLNAGSPVEVDSALQIVKITFGFYSSMSASFFQWYLIRTLPMPSAAKR
jgi:hypothetical protein